MYTFHGETKKKADSDSPPTNKLYKNKICLLKVKSPEHGLQIFITDDTTYYVVVPKKLQCLGNTGILNQLPEVSQLFINITKITKFWVDNMMSF